jgi:3-phosphoshikimate 1-carboxyvinyltransferase
VYEPYLSRDHTERLLSAMGVKLISYDGKDGRVVKLEGGQALKATEIFCPADPSSACLFHRGCGALGG